MRIIEIGDRDLKTLTKEEVLEIVMIEGCCPDFKYWNKPEIVDFDNKMFGDTVVIDYTSYRTLDNVKSAEFTFYLDFIDFRFHYTRDFEKGDPNKQPNGKRLSIESIKYLIGQGFNVPIYQ